MLSLSAPLAFRSLPLLALSGKSIPRQATTSNLRADVREAFRIAQLATAVTEALFIKITKQVERLHADIRAVKLAFHQTPKVFHRVRVNIAANILYGVIHNGVLIVTAQAVVRFKRIAEQRRASLDVLANLAVKFMLPPVRYGERANVPATLYYSESDGLIRSTRKRDDFRRGAWRMLRDFPPMNDSSTSTSPESFVAVLSCIASRMRCNINQAVF